MEQYKVTVGGTVRVMGGRTTAFMHWLKTWIGIDPEGIKDRLVGDAKPDTRQALLDLMVQKGIMQDLKGTLEELHDDICRLYVRRISAWVGADLTPDVDIAMPGVNAGQSHTEWVKSRYNDRARLMRFWISNCAKGGENYRDASWLLKNMRFAGRTFDPANPPLCPPGPSSLQGFCVHEPVTRFRQLLAFPIERFGVDIDTLPRVEWPQPPPPIDGAVTDVVRDAQALEAELQVWETYYGKLIERLAEFQAAVNAA